MWSFFIENRRFSYLLMLALFGFGLYSLLAIPKESSPEVKVPVGIITTVLPGAPAVDVESLVTNEIERSLSGKVPNVRKITSTSQESVSSIVVEFEAGEDIDASIRKLKDEVDALVPNLPDDAETPVVSEVNFVDQPIMTIAVAGDLTPVEFTVLGDELVGELERVSGVSRVEVSGVRDREVTVLLDESALLRYSLSVSDVVNALRAANTIFPVGQIVSDSNSYNIVLDSQLDTPARVPEIPIAVRSGSPVYLSDVAVINSGLAPSVTYSRLSIGNEVPAESIILSIYKRSGGDITRITAAVDARLDELAEPSGILEGLSLYTIQDAGADIAKDLRNLTVSGFQTIILVVTLLVIAIGWREGLLAGLAIPLSFTIGFIGLYLSGNTINFLSLFSLILGIGVLVDSGIVIVEGIHSRLKANPNIDKVEAALLTVKEFSAPLISGTLTTVAMFVGLFVVSGVTGQFIASIPFTLIFVLFASLLVALGFLPLLASTFLKRRNTNRLEELQNHYNLRLENWYRTKLLAILKSAFARRAFLVALVVGFVSAIALIPLGLVKVVFFAQSDAPALFIEVELPEGSVKGSTDLAVQSVEEVLYRYASEIEAFSTTIGSGSAFAGGGVNPKLANIYVALVDERERTSTEIAESLRQDFAGFTSFKVTVNQPNEGPPTGSPIGVKLFGDDLTTLTTAANAVADVVAQIPGTTNVTTSANANTAEFNFEIDQARAIALGLNPLLISQTLRTAVFGSEATSLTTLNEDIKVMVRLDLSSDGSFEADLANHTTVDRLLNLEVVNNSGERIPLSSVVSVSLREANNVIRHEANTRIVTVSADTTPDGNVIEINRAIAERLAKGDVLPAEISYSLGGESEESNQAFGELFLALIVGIVLMVGILVLQFDSFRHTAYVLSILPFSLIGILYGLAITGSTLSFPSILGFIALSGIVVNNSILLIDMMNQMRRRDPGAEILNLVVEASVSRLRAILLTSATTIAGMIPLLFTDEIWIPLATAIIFGLAFSVVITLILVPLIYSRWPGKVNR